MNALAGGAGCNDQSPDARQRPGSVLRRHGGPMAAQGEAALLVQRGKRWCDAGGKVGAEVVGLADPKRKTR